MSLSYWQRFQEAFCKRSRRREVALMAENLALKSEVSVRDFEISQLKAQLIDIMMNTVTELTAENEALKKHNEIMKDSLAAAQAEVERLIQAAQIPARPRPRRTKGGE